MSRYYPPLPSTYRLPSLSSRLGWGILRAIPLALFYFGWPLIARQVTAQLGVPFPFPFGTVLLLGLGLLVLSTASYVAKPTRLYGPVSLVYALALLGYLYWLSGQSTAQLAFMGAMITVTFTDLMLLAMVIPALLALSSIVTTIEDGTRPAERYPLDFPA